MSSHTIVTLLGRTATDPLVVQLSRELGIDKEPRLARGEYDAHAEAPARGVSLVFRDETYLRGGEGPLGKSPLVLVGAHLYREGHEGYSEFSDPLPMGIAFTDTRAELTRKLGPSEWTRERQGVVRRERWIFPELRVLVTYDTRSSGLAVVYVGIV